MGWEWVNAEICEGSVGVAASRDEAPGAQEGRGLRLWGGDGECRQHQGFAVGSRRLGMSVGPLQGM